MVGVSTLTPPPSPPLPLHGMEKGAAAIGSGFIFFYFAQFYNPKQGSERSILSQLHRKHLLNARRLGERWKSALKLSCHASHSPSPITPPFGVASLKSF